MKMASGAILVALAIAGGVFAWIHRPIGLRSTENLITTALSDPNHWVFKDGVFYGVVAVLVLMLVAGIIKIISAAKAPSAGRA